MSLLKLLGLTLSLTIGLTACSSVKEDMRPAKLEKISPTLKIKHVWSNFVGVGQDARYSRLQPIIVNGFLYTVDVKGHIKQLTLDKGDINWTVDVETPIGGGLGSGGGLLFVGAISGELIAIDPQSHQETWRTKSSSEIISAPQSNDEVVIASAIDGRVFAYDIKDGSERWNYDHPVPVLSLRSTASPLVKGQVAFVGFDNGQVLSFNTSNGQLIWSARVGQPQGKTELDRLVDVDSNPIELGPYVYAAGYNSRIIAITRGSGTVAWAQDVSTTQNIVASDNTIVIVDSQSHIKAFDALNGTIIWQTDHLHRRNVSAPAVLNGTVIVVDDQGVIHGLSLKTGESVARLSTRHDSVFAQPLVEKDIFYILDVNGEMSAYSFIDIPASVDTKKSESVQSIPEDTNSQSAEDK